MSEFENITLFDDDSDVSDEDFDQLSLSEFSQAVVTDTNWTTETIILQVEKGNIQLNPDFQRREAWTKVRQSRFIESLFLGLPIPEIVLAVDKNKKGAYIVIDGKQRLLSILKFAAPSYSPDLVLTGLKKRTDLNNHSYYQLKTDQSFSDDINQFDNETIRTVVIKNWPNNDFLYLVFLRLNTGSVRLSTQELRHALHPGQFIDFANSYAMDSEAIMALLKITKPDFRMRDTELVVRYYAFKLFLSEYRGNLKDFLDNTCDRLNNSWATFNPQIIHLGKELTNAIKFVSSIFGVGNEFRKWVSTAYEPRINRPIYDIMVYFLSDSEIRLSLKSKGDQLINGFKNLCAHDQEFMNSIERTTKSLAATSYRFNAIKELLESITKCEIDLQILN